MRAPTGRNVLWVVVWIGLGLALGLWVLATQGTSAAAEYYAAYFLEKSLSVDNIFVFVILFSELHIPPEYQHRVLRFGIAGALVFRALLIGAGIALIERFDWVIYPFAVLMLFAAWRLLFGAERERAVVQGACDVCETWIVRVVRVSPVLHGHDFWRREGGRLVATPLFVALVVIETTDFVFALDSVSALLAVTRTASYCSPRLPRRRWSATGSRSTQRSLSGRKPEVVVSGPAELERKGRRDSAVARIVYREGEQPPHPVSGNLFRGAQS